ICVGAFLIMLLLAIFGNVRRRKAPATENVWANMSTSGGRACWPVAISSNSGTASRKAVKYAVFAFAYEIVFSARVVGVGSPWTVPSCCRIAVEKPADALTRVFRVSLAHAAVIRQKKTIVRSMKRSY